MILIQELVKKYSERVVVDHLNLDIAKGEFFGLLGPNGAGKTTTIRILTMLTRATSGTVIINGHRVPDDAMAIKASIGVVSQHLNLDGDLTVGENLDLHGRLHRMPASERRKRIDELLAYAGLDDRLNDMIATLSGGMKRQLMIARALLHRPQVLFLDEPTVGLDPHARRKLWDLIKYLNREGLTVLLTTHYIEEAENLCDRVAIMDYGKLIALDTPAILCQRLGKYVVEWTEGGRTQYGFFFSRPEAADFAGNLANTALLRRCNLEDVFVKLTGRKVIES